MRELRGFWRIHAIDRFCGEGRDTSLRSAWEDSDRRIAQPRTKKTQGPSTPGRAIQKRDRKNERGQSLGMTGARLVELRKKGRTGMSAPHKQESPLEASGLHQNRTHQNSETVQLKQPIRGGRSGPSGGDRNSRRRPTSTPCRNQSRRYRLRDGRCRFAWCPRRAGGLRRRSSER
jgi:hypothetical protein